MKKILIKIKNNNLIFKERTKLTTEHKSLLNTNVISSDELVFSDDYIIENKKIVITFINELCKTYQTNTAIIENESLYLLITELFKNNKYITSLILKEDITLSYKMCELIINSNIASINCYNLQPFMLELLDKNNIIVESRNEILFLSNFMIENNLNIFSSLFYKMTLKVDFPMNEQDEEDFTTFCKINKYLKTIHVNRSSLRDLEFIIDILKKCGKKNIKIIIHDNVTDPTVIEFLKNFNKRKSKRYKIFFKLSYSDNYIKENIIKQTNSKILRTCGLIIIFIIVITFTYVFYDNYMSMQNVNNIKENITKVIEITDVNEIIKDLDLNDEEKGLTVINEDIAALLSINPETRAWIKVNNTNIDYPIVQTSNNDYYLKHNFNLQSDNNGWVFMDYRNNYKEINDNTIIYAHNRYYSGVMFGTLQNTLRYSWYTNEENQTITFRTLYGTYEYEVFSIYKIRVTTDYVKTLFASKEDKLEFFTMLKNRSVYDFNIELTGDDKIITLSTCADEENRIVLHAKLKNTDN